MAETKITRVQLKVEIPVEFDRAIEIAVATRRTTKRQFVEEIMRAGFRKVTKVEAAA